MKITSENYIENVRKLIKEYKDELYIYNKYVTIPIDVFIDEKIIDELKKYLYYNYTDDEEIDIDELNNVLENILEEFYNYIIDEQKQIIIENIQNNLSVEDIFDILYYNIYGLGRHVLRKYNLSDNPTIKELAAVIIFEIISDELGNFIINIVPR